jgi:hypothetical protein
VFPYWIPGLLDAPGFGHTKLETELMWQKPKLRRRFHRRSHGCGLGIGHVVRGFRDSLLDASSVAQSSKLARASEARRPEKEEQN